MAITKGEAEYLIYLAREGVVRGRVATFGRMTMLVDGREAKSLARQLNHLTPAIAALPDDAPIDDQAFFAALGVDSLTSIDAVDIDSPTMIGDLSKPLPAELDGAFDVVLDSGTMEHIANFSACLENACRLVKVGGFVIHSIPSTNFLDHGYFSVSPIFYVDFFAVNRWLHPFMALYDTKWGRFGARRKYWRYAPEVFGRTQWSGQFHQGISVASVVQRTADSTFTFDGVIQREFLSPSAGSSLGGGSIIERLRAAGKALLRSNPKILPLIGPPWYWIMARYFLAKTQFRLSKAGPLTPRPQA